MFQKYLKRDWIKVATSSKEDVIQFMKKHSVFMAKPIDGGCGKGIQKINIADYKSIDEAYNAVSAKEDNLVGIVKNVSVNKLGDTVVTIVEDRDDEAKDGVEYILADGESIEEDGENGVQAIIYSIEENKDGDWELTVNAELTNKALTLEYDRHGYIKEATSDENPNVSDDGREAKLADGSVIDLDDEDTAELYEDARFFIVNVVLDEDETEDYYMVDNYSEVEYADVAFEELDRLSVIADGDDVEFVIIIRGMDAMAE
jgi:hypothetical protein